MTDVAGTPAEAGLASVANGVDTLVEGLRTLGPARSLTAVMALTTRAAAAGLAGADDAALTVPAGAGGYRTTAATSEVPIAVDALQYEHGGPCLDTLVSDETVVHVDDLREDTRWPGFASRVVAGGSVLSMLSYRLWVRPDQSLASLNLYAAKPHAFTPEVVHAGEQFAAYAAVVLAHAAADERVLNLERALDSNREIGAAVGILMTRRLIIREQALELLRAASQASNRKLRDVAEEVIQTGDLDTARRP